MSLTRNDDGRIRSINKLVNQFASSIRHKPFVNDFDKARVLGFIAALRDVITDNGKKPIKRPEIYESAPYKKPTEEQRIQSRIEISKVRDNLRKGKANELDG